ncbi:FAD-binding oxidoreductase [Paraburkholderia saeva]|uniref:Decaprenylphosphoryl-beta-D-ribose oxidase n=1 Tax=Paraburkholderia saeva TaxID=2777537 RepID=A0A9N8X2Q5_9BURK|nr:FAD-binding oxidoreductase [Paraburkholderia saeva]CAG4895609.1 Decaprenylphosphoryl-beta-D-ribose oxidase [Paraburkholderia saeva]CAG4903554.1 Decaprenylphosphoryl-beta-D-ribose oxidase [Paraburkholderia saeva]
MSASKLQSWGHYPYAPQSSHPLSWRDAVQAELDGTRARFGTTLPFGNGRSYGDSCLAATDHVLHMRGLGRFISADWERGILRAEAGVMLGEVLELSIPRGWMLPVTPGTQFVTLAGAVANDVHGKNHHVRGTFGRHVRRFSLLRSDREPTECAPGENDDLFRATISGLGLTGVIEWVEIQLMPVRSSRISLTSIRFANLDEFLALSSELDPHHEYGVAWVDCLASGDSLGRGIYMSGDHAADGDFSIKGTRRRNVPFVLPWSPVNRYTLKIFNEFYYRRQTQRVEHSGVDFASFFYPLDGVRNWNRIYGRRGFQQHQCVIPEAASRDALKEILATIAKSGLGSCLAVLKRCGTLVSPGLLSFPMPGVSLALDFPQRERRNEALFLRLDAIVNEAGGRQYPAKDAHMSGADFRAAYPAWQELERNRDPALMSRFWKRTTQT